MSTVINSRFGAELLVAALLAVGMTLAACGRAYPRGETTADTVLVAPPAGTKEADRGSILAALEEVEPGGTVQFAPGTYLVGEVISVTVPRVTLLGHSDGTTLRGCDPAEMGTREYAKVHCNGLELAGVHQTVRGLTFEYAYWALHLGCCWGERTTLRAPDGTLVEGPAIYRTEGGHLIEGNTFRRSASGLRMNGDWSKPAVVRGNRFVDNWHSVSINGNTVHLLDNDFSVPEPERVPFYGFPNDAVQIGSPLPFQGGEETRTRACDHNVVAGNRIEGSHKGISIMLWAPGTSCRNNVIRDNRITVHRAIVPSPEWFTLVDESDSTFVGIPLSLLNYPEAFGQNEPGQESAIEDNLIEGNRIIGAEGLGIEILHASGNRIVNNTISGIAVRVPFPGNTMDARAGDLGWGDANGSGIWVSTGSEDNEIAGNTFEDVAAAAVFLEGDSNHVEVRSDADAVRDLGTGNRVDAPGTTTRHPELGEVAYESSFVQVRGIRMHYLDFGGPGLPVIFIHGSHANARSFVDFAPRFVDGFRVLALDRRSHGESENVDWGHGTAAQAEDILGFMDALGLQRAVLIDGNVGLTTYLGEHHPDRLAGIVFLRHMAPQVESRRDSAVAEFWDMASRTACDWDEETRQRNTQRAGYRPHFIDDPDFRIDVPALSLANADGTRHPADFDFVGIFLEQVETGEWCDTTAKAYFSALAADTARATELRNRLGDLTGAANLSAFERAFGPRMTIVRLSVPAVTGYEYLRAPDLIYPRIRTFLDGLAGGDP